MVLICLALILVTFISSSVASAVQTNSCKGVTNKVDRYSVEVSDCNDSKNCTLIKGTTHFLKTTFVPAIDVPNATFRVFGLLGPVRVPYSSTRDVCEVSIKVADGSSCSADSGGFKKGTTYYHVAEFPVSNLYPELSLKVRVQYSISRKNDLLCYEVPVIIGSQKRRNQG